MLTLARNREDLQHDLAIRGYTLIRAEPQVDALTDAAAGFGAHIGAKSMRVKVLEVTDSTDWLPRHTENLTDPDLLEYFALGCLTLATSGGATCLYDGRVAARALLATNPEHAGVRIPYATAWRPYTAIHPLLLEDRIRTGPALPLSTGNQHSRRSAALQHDRGEMYNSVEAALSDALVVAHHWRPGNLLIVNNPTMVHARQPVEGTRRMVRYRFDDPHFQSVIISE